MVAEVIPISREIALRRTIRTYASGDYRKPSALRKVPQSGVAAGAWFVRGPFPGEQYATAAQLPGRALVVWQMVHHQCRLRGQVVVTLPGALLDRMGVRKKARLRALRHLEGAGLIKVAWRIGRPPRIQLVEPT